MQSELPAFAISLIYFGRNSFRRGKGKRVPVLSTVAVGDPPPMYARSVMSAHYDGETPDNSGNPSLVVMASTNEC